MRNNPNEAICKSEQRPPDGCGANKEIDHTTHTDSYIYREELRNQKSQDYRSFHRPSVLGQRRDFQLN